MTRARGLLVVPTALVVLVVVLDRRSMVGALLVLGFMSLVPGSALSRLVRFPQQGASGWVVTIGASFGVDVIVTEAMVYAHVWTPARGLITLCVLTFALVGAEYVASRRRARDDAVDARDA